MPRVHVVEKAKKDQGSCCKCHKPIKAGDKYRWLKGYKGPRKVACGDCQFSDSDKTGSDKLAAVYDARDSALESLKTLSTGDIETLKTIATDAAEAIREVAGQYQESADNIHENFSESATADECEEKANELEGYADEVKQAVEDIEEFDEEDAKEEAEAEVAEDYATPDEDDPRYGSKMEEWRDEHEEEIETK